MNMITKSFRALCETIRNLSEQETFENASNILEEYVFAMKRNDFISLVAEMGTIPENIVHDSSEEKLYAKATDITLARCFHELGLKAKVLKERANSADVYAESIYHNYSLVADAKAFRLSRTAKNQKDFKVESMAHWRGDNNYSVLCCPYFQYPKNSSQIFEQALNNNISLFSWEYFSVLLQSEITETPNINLSSLWNVSAIFAENTILSEQNKCFIAKQDDFIKAEYHLQDFENCFAQFRINIVNRGETEIGFWKSRIKEIQGYSKKQAIDELLSALKLNEKIGAIERFLITLSEQ